MKRLLPGIPLFAALIIVILAIVNLATPKRFPIYSSDGKIVQSANAQYSEVKILPPITGDTPLPNGYQMVDLQEICRQALTTQKPATVDPGDSGQTDEICWSSVILSNKKDRIAFYSNHSLYMVNLRNRQAIQLYTLPTADQAFFEAITWGPEDLYLTFGQVEEQKTEAETSRQYAYGLIQLGTGEAKIIYRSPRIVGNPVWSPDGKYLALENPVVLYEVKPGNLTRVAPGTNTCQPRWSPDSRHVIFIQYTSADRGETYRYTLNTREVLQITNLGKAAAPVDWLKSPAAIIFETEANYTGVESGRHHIGETKPHPESSISWLSPFDRGESNRYLTISPNERYVVLRKSELPRNTPTSQTPVANPLVPVEIMAVNRELGLFSWHCVKMHTFPTTPQLSYTWAKNGDFLYLTAADQKWELYVFDFGQLSKQKVWETTTPVRLVGVDGYNQVYYCPGYTLN
ncbi:MAG: hypothetical protein PHU78_00750 [Heliobacteriaceae bacterium]|nr:hypothetical protein [Heliobacteriaceae bacterium]